MDLEKEKKSIFYKKWWVWVVVLGALILITANLWNTEEKNVEEYDIKEISVEKETETEKVESVPREHKSALIKAQSYAENMAISKLAIYDQLVSEFGEQFPVDAAQYAIDTIEFDWKENALKKAQTYAETMHMSKSAIYDQLISEYGEKYTQEEAQYAIDNLD